MEFVTYEQIIYRLWRQCFPSTELHFDSSIFESFWSSVDAKLKRGFSEQLVKGEITSQIQGKRSALSNLRFAVTREVYVRATGCSRRADALSEVECNRIYDLFEAYEIVSYNEFTVTRSAFITRFLLLIFFVRKSVERALKI